VIMHVLFETAYGYALFDAKDFEDIGKNLDEVQQDILDLSKFGKNMHLVSFMPFQNAAHALENMNAISEGIVHSSLKDFLELNHVSNSGEKKKKEKKEKKSDPANSMATALGVSDKSLATSIKQELGIDCISNDLVQEITRGIRLHSEKMLKQLSHGDLERAQLGLGHSYSRGKVRFNVHRSDNMIIQAIALCDQLDKDINLFSMRVREWYSWHFPELEKLVSDHHLYAKLAVVIRSRQDLMDLGSDANEKLSSVIMEFKSSNPESSSMYDPSILIPQIIHASKTSMGTDISDMDLLNIDHFARKVISLSEYRSKLQAYLHEKMYLVAPNLAALVGDHIGARLISQAGSLTNLAKFPASTVQILGAEKALFRALKTKGKTPKYGLLYHASFIGRADLKDKGRISRYLANKCSIASRLDSFSETPTDAFGKAMKGQVEQRLGFFSSHSNGAVPVSLQTNEQVMRSVIESLKEPSATSDQDVQMTVAVQETSTKKSKSDRKDKEKDSDKKRKEKDSEKKKDKDSEKKKEKKHKSH
jgi:nucleolar protein 56